MAPTPYKTIFSTFSCSYIKELVVNPLATPPLPLHKKSDCDNISSRKKNPAICIILPIAKSRVSFDYQFMLQNRTVGRLAGFRAVPDQ